MVAEPDCSTYGSQRCAGMWLCIVWALSYSVTRVVRSPSTGTSCARAPSWPRGAGPRQMDPTSGPPPRSPVEHRVEQHSTNEKARIERPPAPDSPKACLSPLLVQCDNDDHDQSGDQEMRPRVDVEEVQQVADQRHDQDAHCRSVDAPDSAAKHGTTHNYRCDRL